MGYDQERNKEIEINDEMLRLSALSMAIESKCGQSYDEDNRMIFSDDKFVTGAAKFYLFLKEVTKNENV
jgi:hypothetical protein